MAKGKKTGGRKAGVPNKKTAEVKQALTDVYHGIGGVKRFTQWADEQPTEFYKLFAKLLPTEVTGKDGGPIQGRLEVRFVSE